VVTIPEEEYLAHYGTPRHSGRYPWGSGDDPQSQRNRSLLDDIEETKRKFGVGDTEAAKMHGVTTTQLRDIRTLVRNERKQDEIHMARKLKDKGLSNGAIAARMREAGFQVSGESQVRNLLKDSQERKAKVIDNVTNALRKAVDEKEFIDVGSGVEYQLGITSTKLRSALQQLKDEGYRVHKDQIEQLGTGNKTILKVLTKPGNDWIDVHRNLDKIDQLSEYSQDGGVTLLGMHPPLSISSKRVGIRYDKDGGADADGVIYVRPGVNDVSLGGRRYAQVRIMVDGSHYLKGMAVYKDDLPDGVDLQFNTNKSDTGNKLDAMKPLKRLKAPGDPPGDSSKFTGPIDKDNPFGATIGPTGQIGERDATGRITKLTSVMNKVNEEGKWETWSRNLPSQMLSKQRPPLAREQLQITYDAKKSELDAILRLNNPSVRKKLLEAYADGADSSAVHLKAAHLPRQQTQVILPVNSLKDNEVYAPNFRPGERVVLIRFPHAGPFEIPELVVSHKNPEARKLLGDSRDAIGINSKVAERLSGADFDGDTVLVIPNNLGKIRTKPPLEGLKNFSPKDEYPYYEGMKVMTPYEKGLEMGKISNLITDMSIRGANNDELARAVRHSMVVIDAEKHKLNYKKSYEANGIAALVKRYQTDHSDSRVAGASTLISRAKSRLDVNERKQWSPDRPGAIDPKTGKKVFQETGKVKTWVDSKGKVHTKVEKTESTKLAETDDARTLSTGTVIETVYADHSNRLKSLANQARRELVKIKPDPYSPSAKATYQNEVSSLQAKLDLSLRNAPLERQAQVIANATVRQKIRDDPSLKLRENKAELKRVKSQALSAARMRTGADKHKFEITDAEWKAIQARAITAHKLAQILTYADLDQVKKLATPKNEPVMTPASTAKARSLHAKGYSWAEIADVLGVSVSTAQKAVGGEEGD